MQEIAIKKKPWSWHLSPTARLAVRLAKTLAYSQVETSRMLGVSLRTVRKLWADIPETALSGKLAPDAEAALRRTAIADLGLSTTEAADLAWPALMLEANAVLCAAAAAAAASPSLARSGARAV